MPDEASFVSLRTGPDFSDNAGILLSERSVANRRADEGLRIPRALARIVDHPVGHAIVTIAGGDGRGCYGLQLFLGYKVLCIVHHDLRPERRGDHAGPMDRGAAGEDAV